MSYSVNFHKITEPYHRDFFFAITEILIYFYVGMSGGPGKRVFGKQPVSYF